MWSSGRCRSSSRSTGVLIGVLGAGRRLFPGTFSRKRAFRCPLRDRNVNVDFKEAVWDGSLKDVARLQRILAAGGRAV